METNGPVKFYRKSKDEVVNLDTELINIENVISEVNAELTDITNFAHTKQDKQDDNLNTLDKTIVGAINELESRPVMPKVDNETITVVQEPNPDENYLQVKGFTDGNRIVNITTIDEIETKNEEQDSEIDYLKSKLDSLEGKGIWLSANDFGSNPTSEELTQYALEQLDLEDKAELFNVVYVKNLKNNHVWKLLNFPDRNPPIFKWIDDGLNNITTATNSSLGVVKGSNRPYDVSVRYDGTLYIDGLEEELTDIDDALIILDNKLNTEVTNRETLAEKLDNDILNVNSVITDSHTSLSNRIDEETELREQEIETVINIIAEVKGNLQSNLSDLTDNLNDYKVDVQSEIDRLDAKDIELENKILSEATSRWNAIDSLKADINAEVYAINESHNNLNSKLDIEITRSIHKDTDLNNAINSEKFARITKDTQLENLINNNKTSLDIEINDLSNLITESVNDLTNADIALLTKIQLEESRAKIEQLALKQDIIRETENRLQLREDLISMIGSEEERTTIADNVLQINIDKLNDDKLDKTFASKVSDSIVADIEYKHSTIDDATNIVKKSISPVTKVVTQVNLPIFKATLTQSGLMTRETVAALDDMKIRVLALEGRTARFLYIKKNNPTVADIESFVASLNLNMPLESVAIVVKSTNHVWRYYGDVGWRDDGIDTVTLATQQVPGTVLGSEVPGQIYVEDTGVMSLNGYDLLVSTDTALRTGLDAEIIRSINIDNELDQKLDLEITNREQAIYDVREHLETEVIRAEIAIEDLENNKLDKDTRITTYTQVYGKTELGTQTMLDVSVAGINNTLVKRDSNGLMYLDTSAENITDNKHVTNKLYVDTKVAKTQIVQETGTSTTNIMSQDAVSSKLKYLEDNAGHKLIDENELLVEHRSKLKINNSVVTNIDDTTHVTLLHAIDYDGEGVGEIQLPDGSGSGDIILPSSTGILYNNLGTLEVINDLQVTGGKFMYKGENIATEKYITNALEGIGEILDAINREVV